MKTLFLIGGAMGVGKTTVCQILKRQLPNAVFLDGDWCWDADPFQVTEETKAMVTDNIVYLLNGFLRCSAYENVIFCWVMHQQSIIDSLLSRLELTGCTVKKISLVCSPEALRTRLQRDVDDRRRRPDVIGRALAYLPLYDGLDTAKIDVSVRTPEEAAAAAAGL